MIEKVKIENFKGFDKIELPDLKPITLISGKNNVGKSSILEGIFLFMDHTNTDSFAKLNFLRGMSLSSTSVNVWEPLFYQMDTQKRIRISIAKSGAVSILEYDRDDAFTPVNDMNLQPDSMNQVISAARSAYTLRFRYERGDYEENGHFIASPGGIFRNLTTTHEGNYVEPRTLTQFISDRTMKGANVIAEWFGKLELEGKKQQVIDALRMVDPSIQDLSTIAVNGLVQLYAKMGSQMLPLRLAGDGINKFLYIILSILSNPESIFLIDEVETGFHYSMYQKLWETVARAAHENGSQVIATTHSYECISAAADAIAKTRLDEEFCYLRIDKQEKEYRVRTYSDELLRIALETEMEVR